MTLKKFGQQLLCLATLSVLSAFAEGEVYKVATDPYFYPYVYKDEGANIVGFNKDLIDAIGQDQGFTVRMVEGKWPEILDFVRGGQQDMVMAWVIKGTPKTQGLLASEPYLFVPKSGIGYLNDKLQINGVDSLRNLRVGVVIDSSDESFLRDNGVNNILAEKTLFDLFRDTGQGKIDAFVGDRLVLDNFAKKYAKYHLRVKPLHPEEEDKFQPLVAVFRTTDGEFVEKFNAGLQNLKNNGKYQQLITKWFGINARVK